MSSTVARQMKTLALAFATIAPIVAGVSVVSAGTASASCAANPLREGVYRSSNDGLSRIDVEFNDRQCSYTIVAYATCVDDATSDCPWGAAEPFHRVRDNPDTFGYAYHEWNNAYESVGFLTASSTEMTVSHYVAFDDDTEHAPPVTITLTKDQ